MPSSRQHQLNNEVVLLGFNASTIQSGKDEWKLPIDLLVEPKNFDSLNEKLINIFGRGQVKKREFKEYGEFSGFAKSSR